MLVSGIADSWSVTFFAYNYIVTIENSYRQWAKKNPSPVRRFLVSMSSTANGRNKNTSVILASGVQPLV
jgi:hypothetical protein